MSNPWRGVLFYLILKLGILFLLRSWIVRYVKKMEQHEIVSPTILK